MTSAKGDYDPEWIQDKRVARMNIVDGLAPELRELVHAYGLRVVDTCLALGVKQPRQIRHLVELILDEFSPTRGTHSAQGIRTALNQVGEGPGQ